MGGIDEIEDGMGCRGLVDLNARRPQKAVTYKASISCLNCGQGYSSDVPKGTLIAEANPRCPYCGCTPVQTQRFWKENEKRST